MTRFILLLFVTLCTSSPAIADSSSFDINRRDHQLHFGISAAGTVALTQVYKSAGVKYAPGLGMATMLAIGVAKELLVDKHPDTSDFEADVAGSFLGAGVSLVVMEF